jgi:hypothetical protein
MMRTIGMMRKPRKAPGKPTMKKTDLKQPFTFQPRVKMRLSEIERLIKQHRIIVPPPSRQTLIKLCEDGTLETAGDRPTVMGWLVFEDSFLAWLRKLDCGEEEV